tara:strand:+ start:326 stop:703 length:378 start_codon:yes stop_codon:yes gene_type:complete
MSNSYRSGFEKRVAGALASVACDFEYEPKDKKLSWYSEHKYQPDFVLPNGIYIETKGWSKGWGDGSDRSKYLKVREANPEIDLRFVFQNAYGKISSKSKTTNAEWCDKKGFLWSHKVIPERWINE